MGQRRNIIETEGRRRTLYAVHYPEDGADVFRVLRVFFEHEKSFVHTLYIVVGFLNENVYISGPVDM